MSLDVEANDWLIFVKRCFQAISASSGSRSCLGQRHGRSVRILLRRTQLGREARASEPRRGITPDGAVPECERVSRWKKPGTLHRVTRGAQGPAGATDNGARPTRCRPRYRSAALAPLDWNDIYSCPAETSVDLFNTCNVRSPSVIASCLERNVSDERATSIAAPPLQISQPNGRPGGPRRLVTSRNGDALSMPASKACTVPRDGKRNVNGAGF